MEGGVAQMVERSLSMREVPGSIPGASIHILFAKAEGVECLEQARENKKKDWDASSGN